MCNRERQEMKRVPMMPVRDMVIFPQQMTPFIVGREASVRALEEALAGDKKIFLSTQHDASVDDPKPEEIYAVGTLAGALAGALALGAITMGRCWPPCCEAGVGGESDLTKAIN